MNDIINKNIGRFLGLAAISDIMPNSADVKFIKNAIRINQELSSFHRGNALTIASKYSDFDVRFNYKLSELWDCSESPFGICAYDLINGSEDDCVFCHEPNERK